VLSEAVGPVETALKAGRDGRFAWLAFLLAAGFATGLLSLVYYDTWISAAGDARFSARALRRPRSSSTSITSSACRRPGGSRSSSRRDRAAQLLRGLAIGQSAAADQISLAVVLIIGFGLHNATEGLGICAPLAGDQDRPSWGFLGVLGLIAGAPTFFGTVVGQVW